MDAAVIEQTGRLENALLAESSTALARISQPRPCLVRDITRLLSNAQLLTSHCPALVDPV